MSTFVDIVAGGLAEIVNNALAVHLAQKLNIEEKSVKKALKSYDWKTSQVDWTNVKEKTSKAPEKKRSSKKSDISLKDKVSNARENDKWFCVDCSETGRTITRNESLMKKYAYYECGLAGKRGSEKLLKALEELNVDVDSAMGGEKKKSKSKSKKTEHQEEEKPTKAKGKKKDEDKEKPAKSTKKSAKSTFKPKKNDFDNYWDKSTGIVFELENDEWIAMGKQEDDGQVSVLSEDDVETCKTNDWKFKVLDAAEVEKSVIQMVDKIQEKKDKKKTKKLEKAKKTESDKSDKSESEKSEEDEEKTEDEKQDEKPKKKEKKEKKQKPKDDDDDVNEVETALLQLDEEDE